MKSEIYARLAELIEECSERVQICVPSNTHCDSEWYEDNITVVNTSVLVSRLLQESRKE